MVDEYCDTEHFKTGMAFAAWASGAAGHWEAHNARVSAGGYRIEIIVLEAFVEEVRPIYDAEGREIPASVARGVYRSDTGTSPRSRNVTTPKPSSRCR